MGFQRLALFFALYTSVFVLKTFAQSAACAKTSCFPSLAFTPPSLPSGTAPNVAISDWWCDHASEYAFMGFSWGTDECPDVPTMVTIFTRMRNQFGARYVRIYSTCDNDGFTDDLVNAAYQAGVGLFALMWFGFTGDNSYQGRLAAWLNTIQNNPLAGYTIRHMAFGSEPLYDWAITPQALIELIQQTKPLLEPYGIQASVSEMVYGYSVQAGGDEVLQYVDNVQVNELPFFAQDATDGSNAWPDVISDLNWLTNQTSNSKKIYLTQTGWPSNTDTWAANTPTAIASLASEYDYYQLLESKCETFKTYPVGGLGWFAHIFADQDLAGWGVVNGSNGALKIPFGHRTSC